MSSPFSKLSSSDLLTLRDAIEAGRLRPPFTAASIARYCTCSDPSCVASALQDLTSDEHSTRHLARVMDLLADDRIERREPDGLIDLVWTGPEAPGAASRDTCVVVGELFSSAAETVHIAGYAIYQGHEVFSLLARRMEERPDLVVRMYLDVQRRHGDTTRDSELLRAFADRFKHREWPGSRLPEVYYDPRSLALDSKKRSSLHAKCIVIDRAMAFVSSANFTEAAQVRNIEVGILVRSRHFACQLAEHFEALVDAEMLEPVPGM